MEFKDCVAGTWVVISENDNNIVSYHNRIGYIEGTSGDNSLKVRFVNNDYTLVRSEDLTPVSFETYGIEDVKVGDNIALADGSLGCTVTNIIGDDILTTKWGESEGKPERLCFKRGVLVQNFVERGWTINKNKRIINTATLMRMIGHDSVITGVNDDEFKITADNIEVGMEIYDRYNRDRYRVYKIIDKLVIVTDDSMVEVNSRIKAGTIGVRVTTIEYLSASWYKFDGEKKYVGYGTFQDICRKYNISIDDTVAEIKQATKKKLEDNATLQEDQQIIEPISEPF